MDFNRVRCLGQTFSLFGSPGTNQTGGCSAHLYSWKVTKCISECNNCKYLDLSWYCPQLLLLQQQLDCDGNDSARSQSVFGAYTCTYREHAERAERWPLQCASAPSLSNQQAGLCSWQRGSAAVITEDLAALSLAPRLENWLHTFTNPLTGKTVHIHVWLGI